MRSPSRLTINNRRSSVGDTTRAESLLWFLPSLYKERDGKYSSFQRCQLQSAGRGVILAKSHIHKHLGVALVRSANSYSERQPLRINGGKGAAKERQNARKEQHGGGMMCGSLTDVSSGSLSLSLVLSLRKEIGIFACLEYHALLKF
jgi:hypothetical protein